MIGCMQRYFGMNHFAVVPVGCAAKMAMFHQGQHGAVFCKDITM
jgi:hypothetical protein